MRTFGLIVVLAFVYACATSGGASRAPVTFEIGSVEAWRSLKPGMSKAEVKRVLGDPLAVAVSEATNVEGGVVENRFWEQWGISARRVCCIFAGYRFVRWPTEGYEVARARRMGERMKADKLKVLKCDFWL